MNQAHKAVVLFHPAQPRPFHGAACRSMRRAGMRAQKRMKSSRCAVRAKAQMCPAAAAPLAEACGGEGGGVAGGEGYVGDARPHKVRHGMFRPVAAAQQPPGRRGEQQAEVRPPSDVTTGGTSCYATPYCEE